MLEKEYVWIKFSKRAHLFNLFVIKGYRRKGIGRLLMDEAFLWAKNKGCTSQKIMTFEFNDIAKKIYRKAGFRDYVIELRKFPKKS